ncbi:MAG TPA: hypothetical protein VGU73_11165, partial [Acidimicrobiia bacterium]|nr:hypothetical protein [Acidimicrobiia bacterium]
MTRSRSSAAASSAGAPEPVPTVLDAQVLARLFDAAEPAAAPAPVPRPSDAEMPDVVLVTGVARSGTTWVARALAATEGAGYLHEPDNDAVHPYAAAAKRALGAYPYLQPGDEAGGYARCWDAAFCGPPGGALPAELVALRAELPRAEVRRALAAAPVPAPVQRLLDLAPPARFVEVPRHRVIKTVHAALSVPWIVDRWHPRVVVVRRHPLEVLASWQEMGLGEFLADDDRLLPDAVFGEFVERLRCPPPPAVSANELRRAAWLIGVLVTALDDAARSIRGVLVVDHERLCRDPLGELRWLARRCGLRWTAATDTFVRRSQRDGEGYE